MPPHPSEPHPDPLPLELHILVTGFGPFFSHSLNPSHLIATSLPPTLSLSLPAYPKTTLHIHPHPHPLRVSYASVAESLPRLLFAPPPADTDGASSVLQEQQRGNHGEESQGEGKHGPEKPRYDLVLHLGLAPSRKYYALETLARRDGYNEKDVDGQRPPRVVPGGSPPFLPHHKLWAGQEVFFRAEDADNDDDDDDSARAEPEVLRPRFVVGGKEVGVDWEGVCSRAAGGEKKEVEVKVSADAGRFLCEWVFWRSMREYWLRGKGGKGKGEGKGEKAGARPVLFMHVPDGTGEEQVRRGVGVVERVLGEVVRGVWGGGLVEGG